ncbi:MAG: MMPL family transporter [Oscillospiraceae bacterium]|nr:MMPL family transporter [Oscillospiraceae bacterium]
MHVIAAAIVKWRGLFMLLFLAAAVYCGLSLSRVKVNSDLTFFLAADTETRRGITIMEQDFVTCASEDVMVANLTYERAEELAEEIRGFEHVFSVGFDPSDAHYTSSAALFTIAFDAPDEDPGVAAAREKIRALLAPYDSYTYSMDLKHYSQQLAGEMVGVIAIAAAVIAVILLFTSRSYFEVVIFFIVFVFAALLNMGTNFWLGEISMITHTIAVIMQLALAIDYAIIFSHRYQDECERFSSPREALEEALAKSILEISSSSLTTISGLVALMLMQFRLGYDLGIVLSKSIVCSLLTVFLLMPGLILLFPRAIRRSAHRTLIPDITSWGRFLMRSRSCFVWLFLLIVPLAYYGARHVDYAFSDTTVTELVYSESRAAMRKIEQTFRRSTSVVLIVPHEDLEAEKAILGEISEIPEVTGAMGLAGIEIGDGHVLTDRYSAREFAELLDLPQETAELLFQAYGVRREEYQALFSAGRENYRVPLVDLFGFVFDLVDHGVVTLTGEQNARLGELREELNFAQRQLRGEHYNRMLLSVDLPAEGERSREFVEQIRSIAAAHYPEGEILVVGDITSARDLGDSYTGDSLLISILTIVFVFTILLFTFRTVVGAMILVFVIQGSIWINFSFPYLQHVSPSFVTNMIVSAIQMGATIDYAIVLMNRYQSLKKDFPIREAMARAVNQSFATVLTSGSIMTIAGLLIGLRVSDVYVSHIGLAVGRGAFCSVVLVLSVLPQLLVLLDGAVEKTRFRLNLREGDEL